MKNILLSALALCTTSLYVHGQATSLSEDLNLKCATGSGIPSGWQFYNPIASTIPDGRWQCGVAFGRSSTPGVSCSGLYGSPLTYYLDTSILISPSLNLSGYTGDIYLNFDTKTTAINLGARMQIVYTTDTTDSLLDMATDITAAMMPVFSNDDVTDWVTHQANLTPFKNIVPLYIGFRYTSAAGTTGNRWYLDNINTTTTVLELSVKPDINSTTTPLWFSGSITDRHLTLSCHNTFPTTYTLQLLDITGRVIHTQSITLPSGNSTHNITGLPVSTGIYIARMLNENTQAKAKILSR